VYDAHLVSRREPAGRRGAANRRRVGGDAEDDSASGNMENGPDSVDSNALFQDPDAQSPFRAQTAFTTFVDTPAGRP
jgi:hypothetical protein